MIIYLIEGCRRFFFFLTWLELLKKMWMYLPKKLVKLVNLSEIAGPCCKIVSCIGESCANWWIYKYDVGHLKTNHQFTIFQTLFSHLKRKNRTEKEKRDFFCSVNGMITFVHEYGFDTNVGKLPLYSTLALKLNGPAILWQMHRPYEMVMSIW